jgi:AraC-like DNA-binding protein
MAPTITGIRKPITAEARIPRACQEWYAPLGHPALASWEPLNVLRCGISRLVRGYRIGIPQPKSLMVIVTVADAGAIDTPTNHYSLQAGSVYVGVPNEAVRFWCARSGWHMVWWYLKAHPDWQIPKHGWYSPFSGAQLLADLLSDLQGRIGGLHGDPATVVSSVGNAPQNTLAPATATLIAGHLRDLMARVVPNPKNSSAAADPLDDLWRQVDALITEPWPVERLARVLKTSPATLQRLVQRRHGCSVRQAVIDRRLALSKRLLAQTDYSLQLIAERVGYGDAFTLSNCFRKRLGLSPSAFRRASGQER